MLATKTDDMNSIPELLSRRREVSPATCPLTTTLVLCVHAHTPPPPPTHREKNSIIKKKSLVLNMPGIQNYITLFYSASVICGSPAIRDSLYSVLRALTNPRATHNSIYHSVEIKYPMYTTKSHIICASEIRSRPSQSFASPRSQTVQVRASIGRNKGCRGTFLPHSPLLPSSQLW